MGQRVHLLLTACTFDDAEPQYPGQQYASSYWLASSVPWLLEETDELLGQRLRLALEQLQAHQTSSIGES